MAKAWREVRITERIDWDEGLFSFKVDGELPGFVSGQFCQLALDIDGQRVPRAYSLASAPGEPPEFFIVEVEDGRLTPLLYRMKPGDALFMSDKPKGLFTLAQVPASRDMWFVATGTGLAPFLSMLRTEEPWERFERIVLVHGVRTRGNLAYADEVEGYAARNPERFSYVPMVTREDPPKGGLPGRIPAAFAEGALEQASGVDLDPARSHLMLCGNPAMIKDVTALLQERGLKKHRRRDPGHISFERYW